MKTIIKAVLLGSATTGVALGLRRMFRNPKQMQVVPAPRQRTCSDYTPVIDEETEARLRAIFPLEGGRPAPPRYQ